MSEVKRYAPFDGYMFPITTRHGYVRTDDYDALASKLRESERIAAERNVVIGTLGQRVAELEAAVRYVLSAYDKACECHRCNKLRTALRGAGSR